MCQLGMKTGLLLYSRGKQPPEVFYKKGIFKNFSKCAGQHLYRRSFLNKIAGVRPTTLLKKRLRHKCFPVNFVKFLEYFLYRTTPGNCFCHSCNHVIVCLYKIELYISVYIWHTIPRVHINHTYTKSHRYLSVMCI